MQKITFSLEVYSFQTDYIGHVNNAVYIQWMEIGRTKLLDAIGMPVQRVFQQGFAPILVHTSIHYKAPLYMGDQVRGELWLSALSYASVILQFRFYKIYKSSSEPEILSAEGRQKGLFIDVTTMKPRRLLPKERELLFPYVDQNSAGKSE
jgi:acyl-CoA thioester hydrolase